MDIVACTDSKYIMPTGIMMYSVCVNNADSPITFHVIVDKGVTKIQKEELRKTVCTFANKSIMFYRIDDDKYHKLPERQDYPEITQVTYYRLDLANIIPPEIDKVLYLDGDIICRKSIVSLWNTDISQCALAGCPDESEAKYEKENHLHLLHWNGYFNAGVLLINLRWWRTHNSAEAFFSFINEHGDWIKYQDQDVLNYVFNDHKIFLPIKYNLASGFLSSDVDPGKHLKELEEAIHDPILLHYTCGKPWKLSCRHPYRNTFLKYKSQTIWKEEPLQEDRPLSLRVKKAIGYVLRIFHLIGELPPYGKEYLPNLKLIE